MSLRCEGLKVALAGAPVLDGVSLVASTGLNVLVGANGSGKTTLLRALAGLQPVRAGNVWLDGEDITERTTPARRRRGLLYRGQRPLMTPGLISSDYLRLAFAEDSLEHIVARVVAAGFPGEIARELAAPASVNRMPLRARRMLELMTAAADDAKVILLDEPLASLGEDALTLLGPMFDTLANRAALLIVEHRKEFFAWLRDRAVNGSFIADGRLVLSGLGARDLLEDPRVLVAYGSAA